MLSFDEYVSENQNNLLPAFARHCTDCDCNSCAYESSPCADPCEYLFRKYLPDVLRRLSDPEADHYADVLAECYLCDEDCCPSACPLLEDIGPDNVDKLTGEMDLEPFFRKVYLFLHEKGVC